MQPDAAQPHTATDTARPPRILGRGYAMPEIRRSLWLILIAWLFGASFSAVTTGAAITSFLAKYLRADDFSYGLVLAAGPAAVLFFYLGSYINERTGCIKRPFLIFVSLHRLLWLGVAAVPFFLTTAPLTVKVMLVGLVMFCSAVFANIGGAGWTTWISEIVPRRMAGIYFGNRASAGMLAMVLTTIGVSSLLDRFAGQGWVYALIFGIGALIGVIDILIFIAIREIPRPSEAQPPSLMEILVTPWRDAVFRGLAFYVTAAWIAYMMMGSFVWRFCFEPTARHGLGMSLSLANLYLFILPILAMALVAPLWGKAIDRFGPKPVLTTCSLAAAIFPAGYIFMHAGFVWLIPFMAIGTGLFWPGIDQALLYMQIKGFPETRRTAYNAAYLVVMGLAGMIGNALGGVCASFWQVHLSAFPWLPEWVTQYHLLFLTSIVMRIAACVFLLLPLRLPGEAGVRVVTRAVTTEMPVPIPGLDSLTRRWRRRTPTDG